VVSILCATRITSLFCSQPTFDCFVLLLIWSPLKKYNFSRFITDLHLIDNISCFFLFQMVLTFSKFDHIAIINMEIKRDPIMRRSSLYWPCNAC
jgi:hypothetical protein